jgi:hypothetical protein
VNLRTLRHAGVGVHLAEGFQKLGYLARFAERGDADGIQRRKIGGVGDLLFEAGSYRVDGHIYSLGWFVGGLKQDMGAERKEAVDGK